MDTDAPPTDPAPSIPNSESKDEKEDTPQEQQGDNPPGTEEPPAEEKMEVRNDVCRESDSLCDISLLVF